jgi:hypothetical protein
MKLWEKIFAPHNDNQSKVFKIPLNWFNFVTLMLVTPEKFDWTKQFLNSQLWKIMTENDDFVPFIIPAKCTV